MESTNFK